MDDGVELVGGWDAGDGGGVGVGGGAEVVVVAVVCVEARVVTCV